MPEENAPSPRRAPQKKLSDADKKAVLEILKRPDVRVNGKIHVPTICKLTGLNYGAIYNLIRSDRYWHAQVGEADPATLETGEEHIVDANLPTPPPIGVTLTTKQFGEYQALLRQNRKLLAQDWEKLGLTIEQGKRMEHYGTLGAAPTGQVLRVTTGQLISNLEVLDRVIKADAELILSGKFPAELNRKGEARDPGEVERDWRYALYGGMKLQLEMFSHLHKTQAMMLRALREWQALHGDGKSPDKAVYEAATVSDRAPDET